MWLFYKTMCQKLITGPKHDWLNSTWNNATYWPLESQNHLPILIDLGTTSYNSTNGERSRSICPLISFENHMATKISKANQMVGLIRRNFAFLNADLFRRPFIAFLRPHLEYAHPVWSPHLKKHINNIERV